MISLCGSFGGAVSGVVSSIWRRLEVSDPRLCSLGLLILLSRAAPRRGGGAGGAAPPLSCRWMLWPEALEEERMWEELLFERLRRGGGGIGLLSEIGLLGSVVGGVSTAGEPCAGGM